ncbi:MAG: hypothetical protein AAF266_06155 [Planctomycetota bacterium]
MPRPLSAACLAALFFAVPSAQANVIDFAFADLDLVFDGTTLQDGNPDGTDDVKIVSVFEAGAEVPDSPLLGDAKIDFLVPDLEPLSAAGGVFSVGNGGHLLVESPGGETVSLSLQSVQLQYNAFGAFAEFVFGGAIAEVLTPSNPQALSIDPGAEVSFSANIRSSTIDGSLVTGFSAKATGEVENATIVPEPAAIVTLGLLAMAASAAAAIRGKLG